jgi:hypothetical protein
MTESNARLIELCARVDAAFTDDDGPESVFRVLLTVMTKRMSYLCADCREDLADEIAERLPEMLDRANAAAVERDEAQCDVHAQPSY